MSYLSKNSVDPAAVIDFKTRVRALIDELKLPPDHVVGLGLSLAVADGLEAGFSARELRYDFEVVLDDAIHGPLGAPNDR